MSGEGKWGNLGLDIVARLNAGPPLALQIEASSVESFADQAAKRFPSIFVVFGGWRKDTRSIVYDGRVSPEGPVMFDVVMYQASGKADDGVAFGLYALMDSVRSRLMGYTPTSQTNSAYFLELESEDRVEQFERQAGTGLLKTRATYSIRQMVTRPIA